jgi:Plavaka transposase
MRGPDGRLRDCYPVVMSFMVDYLEACLICLVRTNYACPICMAPKKEFSYLNKKYPRRTVLEMQEKIANATSISNGDKRKTDICLRSDRVLGQTVCIRNSNNYIEFVHETHFLFLLPRMHYGNYLSRIFTQQLHQTCFIKLKRVFGNTSST